MPPVDPTIELLYHIRRILQANQENFAFSWVDGFPLFKIAKDSKYVGIHIDDIESRIQELALENPSKILYYFRDFLIECCGFETEKSWTLKYETVKYPKLKNIIVYL